MKRRPPQPRTEAAASSSPEPREAEGRVRLLIAHGKSRQALEAAKELYKADRTPRAEAVLVEACGARIRSLAGQGLVAEAEALLELVRQRHPLARERFGQGGIDEMRTREIEEMFRPLGDPNLDGERRREIEQAIEREVTDLNGIAQCAALPEEHPLRRGAAALQRAFLAVTRGPVAPEAVELAEVSHRSPLAGWKLLVRAIAGFYQGDDAASRRYLGAIRPESVPARLVPAIEAMLGGNPARLTEAGAALVAKVKSEIAPLEKALRDLDRAFASGQQGAILGAIRLAVAACRAAAPGELERLKQHISVRASIADLTREAVIAAMGGTSRHDAYFYRLLARALEERGGPPDLALACSAWHDFRQQAVREGWFAPNGAEAATLYLHMAGVLRRLPRDVLESVRHQVSRGKPKSGDDLYYLDPGRLYQRACALDPHREPFSQWMEWAKAESRREAERVAEAWHKVRPEDIEPLLYLIEAKEKKKAFASALQYLGRAERIDIVNPVVRQARLRLLAVSALRHLVQRKPHLAEEKIAGIEALPQAKQGDRPAFLAALCWAASTAAGRDGEAAAHYADLERLLGTQAAALVRFWVAVASGQRQAAFIGRASALGAAARAALPRTLARVAALAKDLRVGLTIPADWMEETASQFRQNASALGTAEIQVLAEAALAAGLQQFAYATSAAGLERGGATEAKFLLVRARALADVQDRRSAVCAVAAAQLARTARDMAVLDRAVEFLADSPLDDLSLSQEQARDVLRREKAEPTFPDLRRRGPDYGEYYGEDECNCPECRKARAGGFDEPDDAGLDSLFENALPDIPERLARVLKEEVGKAIERGESLDSFLDRIFGPEEEPQPPRKRRRRR